MVKYSDLFKRILKSQRVYDVCRRTPLEHASFLSKSLNSNIYLKREDLQPIFSFKLRGAYLKIQSLPLEVRSRGIVAVSAGNHAQGVAYSCNYLKSPCFIFMPRHTPSIKVNSVCKWLGDGNYHISNTASPVYDICKSHIVLYGQNFDEAQSAALEFSKLNNLSVIHPFNDDTVISGQGTVGMEIMNQWKGMGGVDAIFMCVGGGGLISGVGAYIKYLYPDIKIIGVESSDAPGMTVSLTNNQVTCLEHVGSFADGAAVKCIGDLTFDITQQVCDEMITVDTDEICSAISDAFLDTRVIMEPAGVLSIAGIKKYISQTGKNYGNYIAICSGANMDFKRLRFISERADCQEILLSVIIPEKPGSFLKFYSCIYPRDVTEFSYRMSESCQNELTLSRAHIFTSFEVSSLSDKASVISAMKDKGFLVRDLSQNELAKEHSRYMVGNRVSKSIVGKERIYRFEFPPTSGALQRFLQELPSSWNVSMFHYRNHGADIGRVLVGFQTKGHTNEEVKKVLDDIGYYYVEETLNPIYSEFHIDMTR